MPVVRLTEVFREAALNPEPAQKLERVGWRFAPGGKVIQIDNEYEKEVYNGDLARVAAIDEEMGEVAVTVLLAFLIPAAQDGRWSLPLALVSALAGP